MNFNKKTIGSVFLLIIFSKAIFCFSNPMSWSKETKSFLTMSFLGFGPIVYENSVSKFKFHDSFQVVNEGWFGKQTSTAGMDKLTHLHGGYFFVRGLTPLYEAYGYNNKQALNRAMLGSFLFMTVTELLDGYKPSYGFSYEDFIMNNIGLYLGYLFETNPDLSHLFDIRLLPFSTFETGKGNVAPFENERSMLNYKFFIALKLSGVSFTRDSYLRFFDIHLGYDVDAGSAGVDRSGFAGFNVNVGNIFREYADWKIFKMFDIVQVPYTMSEAYF